MVENRHGKGIHERGQVQKQHGADEGPDRCGAVEAVLVADSLPQRHDGEAHADQIGQPDKHRPPLLQVRDDVGDVVVHVLTCP